MEFELKPGISALIETVVMENDSAVKHASGTLDVYATPAMIALRENAAKSCVGLHLPSQYTTVGIEVGIKHIKPTGIGSKVKCEAILQEVKGKKLFFTVAAWDEQGKIGEGTHVRYIVESEDFMKKLYN
jgi:fluoroacetyl-CoA thioesterase